MEELPPNFLFLGIGHAAIPTPKARPPTPAAVALLDEIIEEILLRVPPNDPASLLRAALVCKQWARLLADRGFRRRYRERHGAAGPPPLLGGLANFILSGGSTCFFPKLDFRCARAHRRRRDYRAHDARHGRVLLNRITWGRRSGVAGQAQLDALAVWDPVTDEHRPLPLLLRPQPVRSWNAALLCAAADCNHLDCHFLVAFVGIDAKEMFAHVYSSESAAWSKATTAPLPLPDGDHLDDALPGALSGNALYFVFQAGYRMLKYDLSTRKLSLVLLPYRPYARRLMAMEDGGLGFAEVDSQFTLNIWSMETGPEVEGDAGKWAVSRAINLKTLLPSPALLAQPFVVAFADSVGVIFLKTTGGLYTFDLKTGKSIRVMTDDFYDIIPYVSFYTPVLRVASTGEGPSAGASTT